MTAGITERATSYPIGSREGTRTEGVGRASVFIATCRTAEERHALNARYNTPYNVSEFVPLDGHGYRSRMTGLDTGSIRIVGIRETGGLRLRTAWRADALGASFAVRLADGQDGAPIEAPLLAVAGPGTELRTSQHGDLHSFRVSLRAGSLDELRARLEGEGGRGPWLHTGLRRPRVRALAAGRLLQSLIKTCAHVERATARAVDLDALVDALADDVFVKLSDALTHGADVGGCDPRATAARRRLADAAVELMQLADDAPLSMSSVCRRLGVSERTLQRAFHQRFGVSLRAYERELRLRKVHWVILVEGDRRTVTDIAMSFGFWHLGRFAGAYKAMFGCTPVETRRHTHGVGGSKTETMRLARA